MISEEAKSGKNTEQLLKAISTRLAGREDCLGMEYKITITSKSVSMSPVVYVYPNVHRKKPTDRQDVLSFVLREQFPELTPYPSSKKHKLLFDTSSLVPGTYQYTFYYLSWLNQWRRKWQRLN